MAAGNINERQIDLRSDSTSNFATLKDFFDSVHILPSDANRTLTFAAGFATADVAEIANAPDGILPLAPGVHPSVSTMDNAGLHGGIVAATKATPLAQAVTTITSSLGHVLNRVEVRDPVSKNPILVPSGADQGAMVFGLTHCLDSVAAGDTLAADGSENLSISLVYINASGVVTAFSFAGDVEFNLNYAFQRRHEPRVDLGGGGGAPRQDEIGGVDYEHRDFIVTAAFAINEKITVSTGDGDGTPAGAADLVTEPTGGDVTVPALFDTSVHAVAELNGVRLLKGPGKQIQYVDTDTLQINFEMDIDDVLTITVPRN